MNKIRKGDTVKVLSGDDKGKTGAVQMCIPKKERVVVAGINMIKKAQRRTAMNVRTQTGIIEREGPMHISKVALVCPNCGKATVWALNLPTTAANIASAKSAARQSTNKSQVKLKAKSRWIRLFHFCLLTFTLI